MADTVLCTIFFKAAPLMAFLRMVLLEGVADMADSTAVAAAIQGS